MGDKAQAKDKISKLIQKYKRVVEEKRLKDYTEEETKKDFIRPLFHALGWDTENSLEVTAERGPSRKRVDYGFRINGVTQFFLEAKRLRETLSDPKYIQQAITYAHTVGCTWAVLSDFEAVMIFNAEWKEPNPSRANVKTIRWDEYLERFEELWLLSKEGFEQGLLDKQAERWGKKRKKMPIDKQLLSDLMQFREKLTKNILKNNPNQHLASGELDEAVQRLIDRLIFIRACEDRELEDPILTRLLRESSHKKILTRLNEIFRKFDGHYNSKVFQPHLCEDLRIDDEVLKEVILGLHRTKDRTVYYDFSIIPADVRGNIYEQYLGHILKKTEKRAKLTSEQAHRKKQGIYYTPTYIVDYIVNKTIGELAKRKNFDMDNIKILDPACGSGSFLINAYGFLYSYHAGSKPEHQQTLDTTGAAATFSQKVQIVKNNIFGVDLDPLAVEIAQLNLLLEIAEKRRRLPLLQQNLREGNSLIDDSDVAGDKAFKWEEKFQEIMGEGGFDVIIGNPPYVRQEEFLPIKQYLEANYETYHSMADLFVYFFERELKMLKDGGYFGMIVSNKWLKAGYGLELRKFLSQYRIHEFIDFGDLKVFQDATTYPCIIIIQKKRKPNPNVKVCLVKTLNFPSLETYVEQNHFTVSQKSLNEEGWHFQRPEITGILKKIQKGSVSLKEYIQGDTYRGILTGLSKAFIIDEKTKAELIHADSKSEEIIKPFLTGSEVRRYGINFKNKYIILTKVGTDIGRYPAILKWLKQFEPQLKKRWDKGDYWYELRPCAYYELFKKPKIIYGVITVGSRFTIDECGYYANNANFFIPSADKQLLAILNSKLGWFLITNTCTQIRGGYQLIWKYFGNVPIVKKKSPQIEILVDEMLSLNNQLRELGGKKTDRSERIEEEINKVDEKINNLVYDLYGITDKADRDLIEESLQ